MKLRLALWIALLSLGIVLVPLGISDGVFMGVIVFCFVVIIATSLRSAWRQGHSGSVLLPIKRGPFGYDGLKLKTSALESGVLFACAILIVGMFAGLVIAIGLE